MANRLVGRSGRTHAVLAVLARPDDRLYPLSRYLARARRRRESIIVTHHGKPYALIQPISERDLETLDWKRLAEQQLRSAWTKEDDALYDYL